MDGVILGQVVLGCVRQLEERVRQLLDGSCMSSSLILMDDSLLPDGQLLLNLILVRLFYGSSRNHTRTETGTKSEV